MIVVAILYGLNTILAFVGNLFVLLVVITKRSFHNMRYFLLASLALSDFLFAVLITSNRTVATALEKWIFGTLWCYGAAYLIRVLHFSTVLHLCAVSWERYNAIVHKPLTYNGRITKKNFLLNITLLWIVPAVISFGPFFGWGDYVYNPDIFVCEQKWDKQTTFPLLITSFLVPLGVIFILNYKVLTVVSYLQRSLCIIGFKPNEIQDPQNQQQCDNEFQDAGRGKQNQQREGEDIKELGIVSIKPHQITTDHNEIQCYQNSAYPEDPAQDLPKVTPQDVFVGQRENVKSALDQLFSVAKGDKHRSSANKTERCPSKNRNKTMVNGKKCLDRKEKQPTRPEPEGRYQPSILAKTELQIEVIEEQLFAHHSQGGRIQDVNGSDKESARETYTQERIPGKETSVFPQFSCEIVLEKVTKSHDDGKSRVESQKRNPRGNEKVPSENEIQKIEPVENKGDNLDPVVNPQRKKGRRPPGKTQMILGIMLIEGKAARDVMIITSGFLLCYLPLWILGIYRSTGKVPSVEAILATHCIYCSSMVWNPIIYSVRKKELRKALKKLLKL